TIGETMGREGAVHVIGHSSGGLDARLLVAPGVSLPSDASVERVARRVATVITVATPNRGTPLASFFASLLGQRLLRFLSLWTVYVLRFGRLPISVFAKLGALFARLARCRGRARTTASSAPAPSRGATSSTPPRPTAWT